MSSSSVSTLDKMQMCMEVLAFLICLLGIGTQMGLLDFYFVNYTDNYFWLFWIISDVFVVSVMIWLLYIAICYKNKCSKEKCSDDSNVTFAFIGWLIYSSVLSVKVAVIFSTFADSLDKAQTFGPNTLKLILASSAAVFLFLVLSHHYSSQNSPRQTYLSYLASSVTLDLIDSVLFLQMLIDPEIKQQIRARAGLSIAILFFACFNFILPTFALFKLRYRKGLPSWVPLPYEKLYTLCYFLTVNVPFLVIRSYVWQKEKNDVSVFIVKNALMVVLAFREVWVAYIQWHDRRQSTKTGALSNGQEFATNRISVPPPYL